MTDEEQQLAEEDAPSLNRRERRAQAKQNRDEGESVQDRNARLRTEAAAARRKQRSQEREQAAALGLDAQERMDDALVRSAQVTGTFVRKNFAWLQWIIVLGVGAAITILVVRYRDTAERQKQGHVVASVLAHEWGAVASDEPVEPRDPRLSDPRKKFESSTAKSESALKAWGRIVNAQSPELQLMAQLGRANNLADLGKHEEARAAFLKVLEHPQAKLHPTLSGRAQEGVGMSLEALGSYPEARAAFEKMKSMEGQGNLARFHLGRVDFLMGAQEEAKKTLSQLNDQLSKGAPSEGPADYLGAAVRDLLRTVDPTFAVAERVRLEQEQQAEQAKRLQEMLEEMRKRNGGELDFSGGLPGPAAPMPAPEAPFESTPETP